MCSKNIKNIKVLLTCVGGELAPLLIQNLKAYPKQKVKVIGIDANENAIGRHFCDNFFQAPRGNSKGFKYFIEKLIEREKINLVIPGSDEEALPLSILKDKIEDDLIKFACVNAETIKSLSDKDKTYKLLKKNNIPCAEWVIIKQPEQLVTKLDMMHNKYNNFVIKPAISRGSRNVFVINNHLDSPKKIEGGREIHLSYKDLNNKYIQRLKENMPLVAMEKLNGPVHDLDMLAINGVPIYIVPRKRMSSANPNAGHIIVNNEELEKIGKDIISKLQLSWLYDCDIMFDNNAKPKVIEINPRMSGSTAVSIEAGIPLLHTLLDIHTNSSIQNITLPFGTNVVPYKTLIKYNN